MVELNPVQEMRLANVKVADDAWRKTKLDAHVALKKAIDAAIATAAAQRDLEVRLAFDAGVPKSRINKEGLNTTNPGTVTASLARTMAGPGAIGVRQEPEVITRYEWATFEQIRVRMDGPEFEAWVKAKENTSRFRVGGSAAEKTEGTYWVTNGEVGTQAIGCGDSSTRNTFDLAVSGWLQSREGREDVQAWMANNVGPTEGEEL